MRSKQTSPNPSSAPSDSFLRVPTLCIVVPCYNEAEVLPLTVPAFAAKLDGLVAESAIADGSRVLLVDDGSADGTWELIEAMVASEVRVEGLKLSRNCGHQRALLAGLMEALELDFDAAVSMDCDGQDDIGAVDRMVELYRAGCDVVYGVRSSRQTDTPFKRVTAESFYRLLGSMGVEAVFNHADYRLMSRRALAALSQYREVNLFLRGLVPLVGFRSATVEYERREREAGESHYPLSKMLSLAVDGITSLSIKPIRVISACGLALSAASLAGVVWAVAVSAAGDSVPGWASLLVAVLLVGGLQLLALGIIGEYVGRIYLESKGRPRYIVERSTMDRAAGESADLRVDGAFEFRKSLGD